MAFDLHVIPKIEPECLAAIHPKLSDAMIQTVILIACKHFDAGPYREEALRLKGRVSAQLTQKDFAKRLRRFIEERGFSLWFLKEDFNRVVLKFSQDIERALTPVSKETAQEKSLASIGTFQGDRELFRQVLEKGSNAQFSEQMGSREDRDLLMGMLLEAISKAFELVVHSKGDMSRSLKLSQTKWEEAMETLIHKNLLQVRQLNRSAKELFKEWIEDLGNDLLGEGLADFFKGILKRAFEDKAVAHKKTLFNTIWGALINPHLSFYRENCAFPNATMLFWAAHEKLEERELITHIEECLPSEGDQRNFGELSSTVAETIAREVGQSVFKEMLRPFNKKLESSSLGVTFDFNVDFLRKNQILRAPFEGIFKRPVSLELDEPALLKTLEEKIKCLRTELAKQKGE